MEKISTISTNKSLSTDIKVNFFIIIFFFMGGPVMIQYRSQDLCVFDNFLPLEVLYVGDLSGQKKNKS